MGWCLNHHHSVNCTKQAELTFAGYSRNTVLEDLKTVIEVNGKDKKISIYTDTTMLCYSLGLIKGFNVTYSSMPHGHLPSNLSGEIRSLRICLSEARKLILTLDTPEIKVRICPSVPRCACCGSTTKHVPVTQLRVQHNHCLCNATVGPSQVAKIMDPFEDRRCNKRSVNKYTNGYML